MPFTGKGTFSRHRRIPMRFTRKRRLSAWKKKKKRIAKGTAPLVNPRSNVSAFPKMYVTSLRYCETVNLTSSLDAPAVYSWRPDGLYDPNYTGTGHQPLYFDQLMALYFEYGVLSCKATSTFTWDAATTPLPGGSVIIGCDLDENATLNFSGRDSMVEENRMKYKTLTPEKNYAQVVKYYTPKSFFGIADMEDNDSVWGGIVANPTKDVYLNTFMINQDSVATTVSCRVLLEFRVKFRHLNDVGQS